ncbi:MAG TPA: hypothetical protein VFB21_14320 [Chthonomonadaceae bacterium]|nr:hypothetical protein [Chthonomonadaceae bacterium]
MFHLEAIGQFLHDLMGGAHADHTGDAATSLPADTAQALAASGVDISTLSDADLHALLGHGEALQSATDSAQAAHAAASEGVRFGHWAGSGETSDGTWIDVYDY